MKKRKRASNKSQISSAAIGQVFHTSIVQWLRKQGFSWVYRIPTGAYWDSRFESKPPFDLWALKSGESWCIECKTSLDSFSIIRLMPHQLAGLQAASKAGAKSYVALEFRTASRVFLVPIASYLKITATGAKILKVEDVEGLSTEIFIH